MADSDDRNRHDFKVGDLVWNPKMGDGHVLVSEKTCSGDFYCGYCGGMCYWTKSGYCEGIFPQCECGSFDVCDHHGWIIARSS
jgi:hypothetical protein